MGRATVELTVEKADGSLAFVDTVNGGLSKQGKVRRYQPLWATRSLFLLQLVSPAIQCWQPIQNIVFQTHQFTQSA